MRQARRSSHADAEIVHLIDYSTVDRQKAVAAQRLPFVVDGGDRRLDRDLAIRRNHLAPVDPAMRLLGDDGLELGLGRGAEAIDGGDLEQLHKRLEAERAGPDRIADKMGLKEPLACINALAAADETEPPCAAARQ